MFPNNIWLHVFHFLNDNDDQVALSQTCKHIRFILPLVKSPGQAAVDNIIAFLKSESKHIPCEMLFVTPENEMLMIRVERTWDRVAFGNNQEVKQISVWKVYKGQNLICGPAIVYQEKESESLFGLALSEFVSRQKRSYVTHVLNNYSYVVVSKKNWQQVVISEMCFLRNQLPDWPQFI